MQVDSLKETRNQYIKLLMEQYVFQMNPVSTEYGLLFTQGGLGTLSKRALLTQGEPIH